MKTVRPLGLTPQLASCRSPYRLLHQNYGSQSETVGVKLMK